MRLTEEEKKLILDKREAEESKLLKKTGVLKEDLFIFEGDVKNDFNGRWLFSLREKESLMRKIEDRFTHSLSAGSIFDCYIDNGIEFWFDREYGLENLSADWAKDHLKDIKPVGKKKVSSK